MSQSTKDKANDYYFGIWISLWVIVVVIFSFRLGYLMWKKDENFTNSLSSIIYPTESISSKPFSLILFGLLIAILAISAVDFTNLNNTLL
tara:strand:- start:455 stop:724 length:270 start_codon:yes stop_codon:yes gene_type:complete